MGNKGYGKASLGRCLLALAAALLRRRGPALPIDNQLESNIVTPSSCRPALLSISEAKFRPLAACKCV